MGDVCTGTPTSTIFATSTSQGSAVVSTVTSQSVSVGLGSVVTRSVLSGTEWIFSESSVGGSTETVQVEVPVTISGEQQVFTVPISTLFAPCTSTTPTSTSTSTSTTPTSTSTSTSTTPTSTSRTSTVTPESETSTTERTTQAPTSNTRNTNTTPNTTPTTPPTPTPTPTPPATPTPTPTPTPQAGSSVSETGTLTTFSAFSATTLPNGAQSTVVVFSVSSIAPSGGLNGNGNNGSSGNSGSNSGRAVAIGVGVAGGFVALIILIFGITWHIRNKRKNALPLDDSDIWGPHHEAKTPPLGSLPVNNLGPGYTYNPYTEPRAGAYAPVPTASPPRARPMVLAEIDDNRLSAASYGSQPPTAPLLTRAKTADQILYEAAREGLPTSRASSATASHHTRPSETGLSYRGHPSFAASHKTHGSLASRTSGSATGLLDHPVTPGASHHHADAPAVSERPMSPMSIAAPRLAIVNPDEDKDL